MLDRMIQAYTVAFSWSVALVSVTEFAVPEWYKHETQLASFRKKYPFAFSVGMLGDGDFVTDKNYGNVSTKLMPGQRFQMKIFKIVKNSGINGNVPSEYCMAFLKKQKVVFTGAQGLTLAYEIAKGFLPRVGNGWIVSLDEKEALSLRGTYRHSVLCLRLGLGEPSFTEGTFEKGLNDSGPMRGPYTDESEDGWRIGDYLWGLCACE